MLQNEGPPEQWPLAAVGKQCEAGVDASGEAVAACSGTTAPLQLPDFVPHNQVLPDIHPGERGGHSSWDALLMAPKAGDAGAPCLCDVCMCAGGRTGQAAGAPSAFSSTSRRRDCGSP